MKLLKTAVTSLIVLGAVGAMASPAQAGYKVRFYDAQYNSPGDDTWSNTSLNYEWVRLKNVGDASVNLKGWTVRDKAGHVFTFPSFTLYAGERVRLHTGSGSNDSNQVYWNAGGYIWNNTGDSAYLRKPSGVEKDVCTWGDGSGHTVC